MTLTQAKLSEEVFKREAQLQTVGSQAKNTAEPARIKYLRAALPLGYVHMKPRGSFYLLDFEVSASGHGLFNLFHSGERLRDNTESRILSLMGDAGFSDRKKIAVRPVLFGFGRAGYYQASAPR